MRLYGVDAPETAQVCKDSAGREYACGDPPSSSQVVANACESLYLPAACQLATDFALVYCAGASRPQGGHCSIHYFADVRQRMIGQLWLSMRFPCDWVAHGALCAQCRRSG